MTAETFLERTCTSLDWGRVLDRLLQHTGSTLGQERVKALTFAEEVETANTWLAQTSEVRALLDRDKNPPVGGLRDVRHQLEKSSRGDVMVGRDFIEIAETLDTCTSLKRFFNHEGETCPLVASIAATLPDLQDLASRLAQSFDSHGDLSATLYPQLAELRRKIQSLHGRIRDRLGAMLESPEMEGILQDRYYTVRSDRYVIPLKVQARNQHVGIIHDASGSGQTVFVEPQAIIPLNNDLKLAESELEREERRILSLLTDMVGREVGRIRKSLSVAAELEFILSRARLSLDLHGTLPTLNNRGRVILHEARHPVLCLRGVQVVPNHIALGTTHQAIVISGPNTGGKTVALKTLGLCALMVRAGLHLPVGAGSEMALFRRVLTDIGDTQTIEGDLSTFSGHITTLRDMLLIIDEPYLGPDGKPTPDALILLDEIAVGTDPVQGAALAHAVLTDLVDRGCKLVVTTHYSELKALSTFDTRFANARVEYDGLRPTYRLVYGPPGRSYALDIARGLGIPPRIITKAESFLSSGAKAIEELLSELEIQLTDAREQRSRAVRDREQAEGLRVRYEKRVVELDKEVDRLRRERLSSLDAELAKARKEIKEVVKSLQQATTVGEVEAARQKVEVITQRTKEKLPQMPVPELDLLGTPLDWSTARAGDSLYLVGLKRRAHLAEDPRGEGPVDVWVGGMKMKVAREEIRSSGSNPAPSSSAPRSAPSSRVSSPPTSSSILDSAPPAPDGVGAAFQTQRNTLDLRGARVDEGLDAVERFLDQASLSGEPCIFVIHGHGTGALRNAIRDYLKTSMYVRQFAPADRTQGGNGVTVVALK